MARRRRSSPRLAPVSLDVALPTDGVESVLVDLATLHAAEQRLAADKHRLVMEARKRGATWTAIARSLEVTQQAVSKRYGS